MNTQTQWRPTWVKIQLMKKFRSGFIGIQLLVMSRNSFVDANSVKDKGITSFAEFIRGCKQCQRQGDNSEKT